MRGDRRGWVVGLVAIGVMLWGIASAWGSSLERLREDVRSETSSAGSDDEEDERQHRKEKAEAEQERQQELADHWNNHDNYGSQNDSGGPIDWAGAPVLSLVAGAALLPLAAPRLLMDDTGDADYYFPRFPYEDGRPGHLRDDSSGSSRYWGARLRSEYSEGSDDISRIGSQLLLDTAFRWGLDAEWDYLEERLGGGRYDHLWLGDCNLVYRFAQSERMEWRTGIGFNWLDDAIDTNFGFNFTYGFDVYPVKPLVFSTELDWGTLGSAEAFHFRTTAGAVIHGLEAYIGYEYRDIDRFHFNGLIAGVRVWF